MHLYGLIGKPLSHSFSKSFFTRYFLEQGLNLKCSYENFELDNISEFQGLLSQNKLILGLNVTSPYKETIIPFLDELSDIAREIKSVNTIKVDRDNSGDIIKITGYNTDVTGFVRSFEPLVSHGISGALILGTGGASKAVAWGLKQLDIPFQFISRYTEKGMLYNQIDSELLNKFPAVINTTTVGTYPNSDSSPPVPVELINSRNVIFDLIYNPAETKLMKTGARKGAIVKGGHEMLAIQALESWNIWNESGN
jgi:shikimate dehydrogenase